jgi:ABC-type sugar transport system substrate-binding protein
MKKLISLVQVFALVLALVFTLAACGSKTISEEGDNTDSKSISEEGDKTDSTNKKIVVGVVQTNANESDWRTANTNSFNEAFAAAGWELKMVYGEGDHAKQISQAQQLIQEEVDYLIVLGLQSAGWEDVAKAANTAGIPLLWLTENLIWTRIYTPQWYARF